MLWLAANRLQSGDVITHPSTLKSCIVTIARADVSIVCPMAQLFPSLSLDFV